MFVDFNAWVFSGSEMLWASLVKSIYDEVENTFGQRAVRAHLQLSRRIVRVVIQQVSAGRQDAPYAARRAGGATAIRLSALHLERSRPNRA